MQILNILIVENKFFFSIKAFSRFQRKETLKQNFGKKQKNPKKPGLKLLNISCFRV